MQCTGPKFIMFIVIYILNYVIAGGLIGVAIPSVKYAHRSKSKVFANEKRMPLSAINPMIVLSASLAATFLPESASVSIFLRKCCDHYYLSLAIASMIHAIFCRTNKSAFLTCQKSDWRGVPLWCSESVESISVQAGLPKSPAIYINDIFAKNAGALTLPNGLVIIFGRKLFNSLNRKEIIATIAHEVGHFRNDDFVHKTLLNVGVAIRFMQIANANTKLLSLVGPFLIGYSYLSLGISRYNEYQADAFAVQICGSDDVKQMLKKLYSVHGLILDRFLISNKQTSSRFELIAGELLSSHPTLKQRLSAIEILDAYKTKQNV
jgi:Zn-dependent protease with chaperone function